MSASTTATAVSTAPATASAEDSLSLLLFGCGNADQAITIAPNKARAVEIVRQVEEGPKLGTSGGRVVSFANLYGLESDAAPAYSLQEPHQKDTEDDCVGARGRKMRRISANSPERDPPQQQRGGSGGSRPFQREEPPSPQQTHDRYRRNPKNGAWTFKAETETDLLAHIENGLSDHLATLGSVDASEAILRSIDGYCLGKQWMYHIGQEKSEIITNFLCGCVKKRNSTTNKPLVLVDLGTYCGYSAIVLAKTILKNFPTQSFQLVSLETNRQYGKVAKKMIQLAKLESYITVVLYDPRPNQALTKALKKHMVINNADHDASKDEQSRIDFLLLDHAKDMYLKDLIELEQSGLVKQHTYVAADNVIFSKHQLQMYRDYISHLDKQDIVTTNMIQVKLEYSDAYQNLNDGIELTTYLKDPLKRH